MARPIKQTVDYFPHICDPDNGKTIPVLQNKYGNDGYTFWFRLLEFLGKRNGLYFDYSNPADLEFLSAKTYQKDTETVLRMLSDLDVLGAIDHELYKESVIWCQNFVDGVADAFTRSVSGAPQRPTPKMVNVAKTGQSVTKTAQTVNSYPENSTESAQKKLKEIKGKEIKENTTTGNSKNESLNNSGEKPVDQAAPGKDNAEQVQTPEFTEMVKCYEKNIGMITPMIAESLRDIAETYPLEWFPEAVKEACFAQARNLRYIERILERWHVEGFKAQKKNPSNGNGVKGQRVDFRHTNDASRFDRDPFKDYYQK